MLIIIPVFKTEIRGTRCRGPNHAGLNNSQPLMSLGDA
jgi:hypothetical protein